jgi:hypothetical protein
MYAIKPRLIFLVRRRSRNITPKILLRRTNTKLVYVFDGKVVQLDKPQIVKRGERTIEYTKVGHYMNERPCCLY